MNSTPPTTASLFVNIQSSALNDTLDSIVNTPPWPEWLALVNVNFWIFIVTLFNMKPLCWFKLIIVLSLSSPTSVRVVQLAIFLVLLRLYVPWLMWIIVLFDVDTLSSALSIVLYGFVLLPLLLSLPLSLLT